MLTCHVSAQYVTEVWTIELYISNLFFASYLSVTQYCCYCSTFINSVHNIIIIIITYGAETWKFNNNLESKLMSMEINFLRSARCPRLEKIRNNVIREDMSIKNSVSDYIRYKQLNWYDHVQRMGEERLPRNILGWCPPGRRKMGRHRNSWMQEVTTGFYFLFALIFIHFYRF